MTKGDPSCEEDATFTTLDIRTAPVEAREPYNRVAFIVMGPSTIGPLIDGWPLR